MQNKLAEMQSKLVLVVRNQLLALCTLIKIKHIAMLFWCSYYTLIMMMIGYGVTMMMMMVVVVVVI